MNTKIYRKTATVEAKLFEQGDEDGFKIPQSYSMQDAMEDGRYNIQPPEKVPYIATLENQKHEGAFGRHYVCKGIDGERWLVDKDIFERTYEPISNSLSIDTSTQK